MRPGVSGAGRRDTADDGLGSAKQPICLRRPDTQPPKAGRRPRFGTHAHAGALPVGSTARIHDQGLLGDAGNSVTWCSRAERLPSSWCSAVHCATADPRRFPQSRVCLQFARRRRAQAESHPRECLRQTLWRRLAPASNCANLPLLARTPGGGPDDRSPDVCRPTCTEMKSATVTLARRPMPPDPYRPNPFRSVVGEEDSVLSLLASLSADAIGSARGRVP